MEDLLKILNNEEKDMLKQINIDTDDLTEIEEQISDYMMQNFVKDDELTEKGIICETILNKIGNLEE